MKTRLSFCYLTLPHGAVKLWWRFLILFLLSSISLPSILLAQNKVWDKTLGGSQGEYLNVVLQTPDGGYILAGSSDSKKSGDKSDNFPGAWLVKLKPDGTTVWDKTISGGSIVTLQKNQDGGYILGGNRQADYWVVKLNADGSKAWEKTIGGNKEDYLTSVQQTKDGGFIVGGSSFSGKSRDKSQANYYDNCEEYCSPDYWIIKLKPDGSKEWDKTIGGTSYDELTSVQQTPDNGYILGGTSNSSISGDKSEDAKGEDPEFHENLDDYWLVKLDARGNKAWDKTIGGEDYETLNAMQQTPDGGYIISGLSYSNIGGDRTEYNKSWQDSWVVKLKANGDKVWDKGFAGSIATLQPTSTGGSIMGGTLADNYWIVNLKADGTLLSEKTFGGGGKEELTALQQTQDGGYIMGGNSDSGKSGDKSEPRRGKYPTRDYWVIKLSNQNLKQIITFPSILNKNRNHAPFSLSAKASSDLPVSYKVITGPAQINGNIITLIGLGKVTVKAYQSGNNTFKYAEATQSFLIEASPVKQEWDKTLGNGFSDDLTSVKQTRDGGYILAGGSGYNWVVKLNASGIKEWNNGFGGSGNRELTSLQQTPDNGYIVGGWSRAYQTDSTTNYWITKLTSAGSIAWTRTYDGKGEDVLRSVQLTQDGGYILGGWSLSDKGGHKTEPSRGSYDYWIIKVDAQGTKQWDKTIGGNTDDVFSTVQQTKDEGYILGGWSLSDRSGDKSEGIKGSYDYWIVKLDEHGTKQWDKTLGGSGREELASLQQTQDSGYILGGTSLSGKSRDKSQSNKGSKDFWVIKLNENGTRQWDKTIGTNLFDELTTLQQTQDGGYVLGGWTQAGINKDKTQASRGNQDYWIVKLQVDGSKVWDKTIGGNKEDKLISMQQTSDGGYVLGGSSNSDIGGDKSEARIGGPLDLYSDSWIVKIKEEQPLTVSWNMRYGGSFTDNLTTVIKTKDGGYLSGGYTNSGVSGDKTQGSQGKNDYWIVKSDKNGKKLWDKRFGGMGEDFLNRVIQTQDGGYLLAGSSLSSKSGDKTDDSQGERDYWLVKVDQLGIKEWDKTYGGSSSDELVKVIQLSTGEYILGGYSNSPVSGNKSQASQGGADYWLVKISKIGTKIWDQRYGGAQDEKLGSFVEIADGGFLLGGSSYSGKTGDKRQASQGASDYWVVRTDRRGHLLWEKTFGGSKEEEVYSIGRSSSTNYFIAGTSSSGKSGDKSQESQGGKDYWFVTINSNGDKIWDRNFGGSKDDELRASTFTSQGHFILAGHSSSGGSGDKTQESQGVSDYWVVTVDQQGQKVKDQRFGGSGIEELRTVTQTRDGGLLLGGRSDSGVSGDRTQASQGSTDYWLVKIAPETKPIMVARTSIQIEEPVIKPELALLTAYPNPVREITTIRFTLLETQPVTLKVFNDQGRETATLFQGEARAKQGYEVVWKVENKAPGLYFLQLQTPTKRQQRKILLAK